MEGSKKGNSQVAGTTITLQLGVSYHTIRCRSLFDELLAVLDIQSACGGDDATATKVVDGIITKVRGLNGCDARRNVEVLRAALDDDFTLALEFQMACAVDTTVIVFALAVGEGVGYYTSSTLLMSCSFSQ